MAKNAHPIRCRRLASIPSCVVRTVLAPFVVRYVTQQMAWRVATGGMCVAVAGGRPLLWAASPGLAGSGPSYSDAALPCKLSPVWPPLSPLEKGSGWKDEKRQDPLLEQCHPLIQGELEVTHEMGLGGRPGHDGGVGLLVSPVWPPLSPLEKGSGWKDEKRQDPLLEQCHPLIQGELEVTHEMGLGGRPGHDGGVGLLVGDVPQEDAEVFHPVFNLNSKGP
eukprot:CAMPEP_0174380640 /NCGR_PEP_ID=MMETSP0811_2-20130205/123503_1 /TAXON_ID=73025 ORGANISM="Eutreptiella gymnastica-like, Strain CCMP1594" /NCGR_SAMPLE_ID=MMETSP0811_2 /ASSEMBLY_ACC=CAM_ASM_000667 /LENGTH=220 /DNA_ID=CAMNT_0015533563 /DNA_START=3472 /DNA_END=4136 /DNA_ORIENTATION=-